jgi:hypothetical protein
VRETVVSVGQSSDLSFWILAEELPDRWLHHRFRKYYPSLSGVVLGGALGCHNVGFDHRSMDW